jgi:glyoxylase-like metal-dependent hydrolase (beta-lactamase superfamily II)
MPAVPASSATVEIGSTRLSFIPDGVSHQRPAAMFTNVGTNFRAEHPEEFDEQGWMIMTFGSFLLQSGDRNALIDLGWGPHRVNLAEVTGGLIEGDAIGGELLDNLAAFGVSPTDIDTVLYSHLHPDHIGWVADADGSAIFPNATNVVTEQEWSFWLNNSPSADHRLAPNDVQKAVIEKQLSVVQDGDSPLPGVSVMLTAGHTPGHASFVVSSPDRRAIVLGDAVHCPIELVAPNLVYAHDVDAAQAAATRVRLDRELTRPGTLVAAGHFPAPTFRRLLDTTPRELAPALD